MITLALERLRLDTGEIETTTPMEFMSYSHAVNTVNNLNKGAHICGVVYLFNDADIQRLRDADKTA